jgi:arabinogalactan endo-1,4-beta-galactosidase
MNRQVFAGIILLWCNCWSFAVCRSLNAEPLAIGADLSFMKQAEESGFIFNEAGVPKACLDIFRGHGYNWIRLRLFHTPLQLPNNLDYTIELALKAKKRGFRRAINIQGNNHMEQKIYTLYFLTYQIAQC